MDRYLNHPLVTDTDIDLTTTSGIHGPPIAEWVVMNWLVSSRMYDQTSEWQRKHIWTHNQSLMHKMEDSVSKRVGILGYGSIGRQGINYTISLNSVFLISPGFCFLFQRVQSRYNILRMQNTSVNTACPQSPVSPSPWACKCLHLPSLPARPLNPGKIMAT